MDTIDFTFRQLRRMVLAILGKPSVRKSLDDEQKVAPGKAEMDYVHHAPNSQGEYDYDNEQPITSRSIDWANFLIFKGFSSLVNCNSWGKDETCPKDLWTRPHHKWWLKYLLRAKGLPNSISKNWWKYTINPERI